MQKKKFVKVKELHNRGGDGLEQAEAESILPIAKRHIFQQLKQMKMRNPSYILKGTIGIKMCYSLITKQIE